MVRLVALVGLRVVITACRPIPLLSQHGLCEWRQVWSTTREQRLLSRPGWARPMHPRDGGFRRLGGWPPVAAGQEAQHHKLVVCWHAINAATFRVLLWKSVIYKQQCRSKTIKTIHSSRLPSVFKTQRSPCSTISAAPADSLSYQSCTSSARSILQIPNLGLTRSCFHALAECPGP